MAEPSSSGRLAEEQVSKAHMEEEEDGKDRSADTAELEFPKLEPGRFPSIPSGSGPSGLSALCAEQRRQFEELFDWLPPTHDNDAGEDASLSSTKVSRFWQWQRCSSSSSSADNTPPTPGKTAVAEEKMMDVPHRETFPGLWRQRRRTTSSSTVSPGGHIRSLLDQCRAETFAGLCRDEEEPDEAAAAEAEGQDGGGRSRAAADWTCCNCHVTVSDMEWTCWHCGVHTRCKECSWLAGGVTNLHRLS